MEWNDWYVFTSQEIDQTLKALTAWANISGLSFSRVSDNSTVVGELRFAQSAYVSQYAHAYLPSGYPSAGDVWMSLDWDRYGAGAPVGTYDYFTLLHEIGHALGLKHPFEGSSILSKAYDSYFYTVMSYSAKAYAPDSVTADYYPTTPMYLDLVAIQYLYGRDPQSNAGSTLYTFNYGQKYWQTIDDVSGTDAIVYKGWLNCTIDLRPGKFSTLSDPITFSDGTASRSTICIGPNTIIERATGGSGNDKLIGNNVNNVLKGGEGRDTLTGGVGNDYLSGGLDSDALTGGVGKDFFVFDTRFSDNSLGRINIDKITDFNVTDDTIRLDDAIFTRLKRGLLPASAFVIGTRAKDSSDRIIYNNKTGDLFYDTDGTGAAAPIKFAILPMYLKLTALDFEII
nr:M10 family metallopeptidase [Microvirga terricola]